MLARFTPGDVDYVVERELALASNYASHSDPSAVLLAGQSGAGKTILSAMLNRTFGGDAFFILSLIHILRLNATQLCTDIAGGEN